MPKKSEARNIIYLACNECKERTYSTVKNKKNDPGRLELKKFMKKLGIDFPETVTKQEASLLIDEELGKNGG